MTNGAMATSGQTGSGGPVSGGDKPAEEAGMPLFMDVHTINGGVSIEAVARAHVADLQIQASQNVRYLRYWVVERGGKVFCLVEAPSGAAAATVHRRAHGLVADEIHQVKEGL
jgi:Protein of unknown function (DUF4242)